MTTTPLVSITGFPELQRRLQAIADDRQKRSEIIKVLRVVAGGTVRVAKTNVPVSRRPHVISGKNRTRRVVQPGALRKSLGVITGKSRENPTVYAGPRAKGNNLGFYGHFVEYGHNIYRTGFKRKHSASESARRHNAGGTLKRTAPNAFMRRTYDITKGQVTAETADKVAKVIQKVIDRHSI